MVDQVGADLSHSGDDGGTAGRADSGEGLAVLHDDGGRHGGQGGLAAGDGVGVSSTYVEVAHLIVQDKAVSVGGHSSAEVAVHGKGNGDDIAFLVSHGEVGRILMLVHPGIIGEYIGHGSVHVNFSGQLGGIVLVSQAIHGHVNILGIAHVLAPVGVGHGEGGANQVLLLGGVMLHRGDVEVLQDVQDLQDDGAAGGGGGRGVDVIATVGAVDRLHDLHLVVSQVLHGQQSAVFLDGLHHSLSDLALVEHIGAVLGDQAQGLGVVLVDKGVPHIVGQKYTVNILQENLAALRVKHQLVIGVVHVSR